MPPKKRSSASPKRAASRGRSRSKTPTPRGKKATASPLAQRTRSRKAKGSSATPRKRTSVSPSRSLRLAKHTSHSSPLSQQHTASVAAVPELMDMHTYRFPDTGHAADHGNSAHRRSSTAGGDGGSTNKLVILGQMLACVAGIYFCFSMWSLKQERLMTMPYGGGSEAKAEEYFPTVFGVSLAQNVAGGLVAFAIVLVRPLLRHVRQWLSAEDGARRERRGHGDKQEETITDIVRNLSSSDVKAMVVVGFATAFGATLGYAAMRRLSFPVVLATKMSKMVPVMVVGFVVYGTRYSWRKVASCALITAGILSFYLMEDHSGKAGGGDKAHGSGSSGGGHAPGKYAWVGFLLLFANLFLDGFANSTQDVLVKRHGWTGTTLMLCTNVASALWAWAVMLLLESTAVSALVSAVCPQTVVSHFAFGDLSATVAFLPRHPDARWDLIAMSMLNAVGQIFIYQTISLFGTLTLTAMTLVRKAGSVLLSIFVHGHAVSTAQWGSLAVVLLSVVFEAYVNVTETAEKRKRHAQHQRQQRHGKAD